MKITVTGAAGYIGRHVIKELLDMGHSVTAIDLQNNGLDERATFLKLNIFENTEQIYVQTGAPDLCIHLAWRDGFVHNSAAHMGTLSNHFIFLKNMIDGGCKNIAVMGSMHEIGYWEGKITADTPCTPQSQYGIAKNALRQALMQLSSNSNFNLYWLRAYYILGDDLRNNSIFTKILQAASDGKSTFPFNSGKNKYDFIDINELARQIAVASTQTEYTGIINLCSGKPITLAEKVESFIAEKDLKITLQYGAFPDRPYDSPIVYGDADIINQIMKNYNK